MSGITSLGTTYNLPNYTGILYQLTPADTPFLSAIGGLSGGGQTTSTQFEWETFDLRSAAQNVALEGAAAPTAQERVRANVTNVCQIQQETLSVSYTKLAAIGQKAGLANNATNPIDNELDWQVQQMLKQMVRDTNYSFLNGAYQLPTDNTTTRQTKGMISAVTTNVTAGGTVLSGGATIVASTGVFTSATHGLSVGDELTVGAVTSTTGITAGTTYFVLTVPSSTTFTLSATKGGAALTLTTNGSVATVTTWQDPTVDGVNTALQAVWDNGGITVSDTATLVMNSTQKRKLTKAYASAYGKYVEQSRNVGGVNLTMIETDFGTLNVMLDRTMPQDKILIASLEQCMPVFLEVPGKGHFFAEPLSKVGASDQVMLYGEVGLAYGNEKAHGQITQLKY